MGKHWLVGLTCALGLLGCGGDDDDTPDSGAVVVDGAVTTVDAATTAMMVGPAGGTVMHASGVKIVVPAGAVATMTSFTIAEVPTPAPASLGARAAIGKVYQFGPSGVNFTSPVTLTLPYDTALAGTAAPAGFKLTDLTATPVDYTATVDSVAHTVSAPVPHFTPFGATRQCGAAGSSCGTTADCCPGRGLACAGSGELTSCSLAQ